MTPAPHMGSIQTLQVYSAAAFRVVSGVAEGDAVSFADDLVMDDVYGLSESAERRLITVAMGAGDQQFQVAPRSATGTAGNTLVLDCCLTLMGADGSTVEALVLVEVEEDTAADVYLLPLATLTAGTEYRLVGVDRQTATSRFSEVACVSFTSGTHITMAGGQQRPIEQITVGDMVLTRDDGPQRVRWVGQNTVRAIGAFAPVVIRKGVLNNENDLVVSPDHRIFVYQRQDRLGAGRAEVLVKVRHLINGDTVIQRDGGFVEYFQLLFDDHQIIYAEGIAAESMLIDNRTRRTVPDEVGKRLGLDLPGQARKSMQHYEVQETLLSKPDALDLLRRASSS